MFEIPKERIIDAENDKDTITTTTATLTAEKDSEESQDEHYIPRWYKTFMDNEPNDTKSAENDNKTSQAITNINKDDAKELNQNLKEGVDGADVDDNKIKKDGEKEDNESNEDYEEDYEDETDSVENVCTAEYFIDKIIPKDYPTEITKEVHHLNETILRLNRMYNFSSKMLENLNPFFREVASRFTDFVYESELDPECMAALFKVVAGLRQRKPWAMSCKII